MAREGLAIAVTVENLNPAQAVRKTASWVSINQNGETTILDVGKHEIMRRVEINARDLRILDPLLSYPSTILGRERVIVLNLEVLLRDPEDELVIPVVEELRRRLPAQQVSSKTQGEDDEQQGGQNDAETDEESEFPFEFRALEVALEAICSFLDARTRELESDTYPALDELTSK
uniref:Magnesium transporter n=1 Tax=Kalanchoe fedtschenkoi TaxID=63787 RepID=A0A7N0RC45_KALFE